MQLRFIRARSRALTCLFFRNKLEALTVHSLLLYAAPLGLLGGLVFDVSSLHRTWTSWGYLRVPLYNQKRLAPFLALTEWVVSLMEASARFKKGTNALRSVL